MTRYQSRRELLRGIGLAGAVSIGLPVAGCSAPSDGGDGGDGGGATPTATSSPTPSSDGDGEEWVQTSTVAMTDELTFEPARIQVSSGTTVTWENVGTIGHTVTAYEEEIPSGATFFASGGFDSEQAARDGYPEKGNIAEGETYEYTFETAGQYKYFCIPHELNGMIGYVKVV